MNDLNSDSAPIGRERELARLAEAFEVGERGGRILLLSGESGCGKTTLAEAALSAYAGQSFIGRAREGSGPPYGPVAAVLRECLRTTDTSLYNDALLPYLALLLPELGPAPAEIDRETLIEAIASTLAAATRDGHTAILFDDLHWADNATLELIPALADHLAGEPIVLIGTFRSDEITRGHPIRRMRYELRRTRRCEEIELPPLNREQTALLIERTLGRKPGRHLLQEIYERSLGIPLFVEEFARALEIGGQVQIDDGLAVLAPGETVPVPESVRDAILLRHDVLSEPARDLLDLAAVLGMEFDLSALAELSGDDGGTDELLERAVIVETEPGRAAFRHALVHETVRNEIAWSKRRSLHNRVGDYLHDKGAPPEQVAEHWLAAQNHARARQALLSSAENSCRLHAYRDAAAAVHRALEIWPVGDDEQYRLHALERFAHCAQIGGQLSEAARAWREVIDSPLVADNHDRRADALRALATIYGLQGAWENAIQARNAAVEAFRQAGRPGDAAVELLAAASRFNATLQLTAAEEAARQAVMWAEEAGNVDIQARAMGLLGDILALAGKTDEGRQMAHDGLTLALQHNESEAASEVYRRLALALASASDYVGSRQVFTTALDFCRSEGIDVHTQVCLSCMSYVLFVTGEWKRTIEVCHEVLNSPHSPPGSRVTAEGILGLVHAYRGETRPARKRLKDCILLARQREIAGMLLLGLTGLAVVEEHEGDIDSAAGRYREILEVWRSTQDRHDVIPSLCAAATFFGVNGMEQDVNQCAEALATIASATGNPEALAGLAHGLGEVSRLNGNVEDAVAQFGQAMKNLERLEAPLLRARTEHRYGTALIASGASGQGIEHLRLAYRTARKLGARPLAALTANLLAEQGEPVEDRRSSDASERKQCAGLTGRQIEVARQLATGLTNREIAGKLFLSTRTVDMHVANILARLDCRSRTEAVRRIGELGLLEDPA
ncbi:AAA family ATPase [candidate division GN15 bacterium]|nr:AAA family ATPase [candidate division GN15 bacterium]